MDWHPLLGGDVGVMGGGDSNTSSRSMLQKPGISSCSGLIDPFAWMQTEPYITVFCLAESKMPVVRGPSLVFLYISLFKITSSLLTRESIGKEAELEMKLAIVSNALMKVSSETTSFFLEDSNCKKA